MMTIKNSGHDSPPPCAQRLAVASFCDVVLSLSMTFSSWRAR